MSLSRRLRSLPAFAVIALVALAFLIAILALADKAGLTTPHQTYRPGQLDPAVTTTAPLPIPTVAAPAAPRVIET
jgi:hypothetical protein